MSGEKENLEKKIQYASQTVEEEKGMCEEAMALTIDDKELNDRFRYIRDDQQKHLGILKMIREIIKNELS